MFQLLNVPKINAKWVQHLEKQNKEKPKSWPNPANNTSTTCNYYARISGAWEKGNAQKTAKQTVVLLRHHALLSTQNNAQKSQNFSNKDSRLLNYALSFVFSNNRSVESGKNANSCKLEPQKADFRLTTIRWCSQETPVNAIKRPKTIECQRAATV